MSSECTHSSVYRTHTEQVMASLHCYINLVVRFPAKSHANAIYSNFCSRLDVLSFASARENCLYLLLAEYFHMHTHTYAHIRGTEKSQHYNEQYQPNDMMMAHISILI